VAARGSAVKRQGEIPVDAAKRHAEAKKLDMLSRRIREIHVCGAKKPERKRSAPVRIPVWYRAGRIVYGS